MATDIKKDRPSPFTVEIPPLVHTDWKILKWGGSIEIVHHPNGMHCVVHREIKGVFSNLEEAKRLHAAIVEDDKVNGPKEYLRNG